MTLHIIGPKGGSLVQVAWLAIPAFTFTGYVIWASQLASVPHVLFCKLEIIIIAMYRFVVNINNIIYVKLLKAQLSIQQALSKCSKVHHLTPCRWSL